MIDECVLIINNPATEAAGLVLTKGLGENLLLTTVLKIIKSYFNKIIFLVCIKSPACNL